MSEWLSNGHALGKAGLFVVGAVLAVYALMLMFRRSSGESSIQATLEDVGRITGKPQYALSVRRPTSLGRIAGTRKDVSYIVIPETTVGRRHATVEYKDDSFWVQDRGSVNGTFVNGRQVRRPLRLKHGDVIRVFRHEFRFVQPEMADAEKTQLASSADIAPTRVVSSARGAAAPSEAMTMVLSQDSERERQLESSGMDRKEEEITLDRFIEDDTLSPPKSGG